MKKRFLWFGVVLVFALTILVSCGKKEKEQIAMQTQMHQMDHSNVMFHEQTLSSEEGKMGEHVICPVSGEKIMVTEKTPYSTYEGKKIYIAGEENKKLFEKDPQGYLEKAGAKKEDHSQMDM